MSTAFRLRGTERAAALHFFCLLLRLVGRRDDDHWYMHSRQHIARDTAEQPAIQAAASVAGHNDHIHRLGIVAGIAAVTSINGPDDCAWRRANNGVGV